MKKKIFAIIFNIVLICAMVVTVNLSNVKQPVFVEAANSDWNISDQVKEIKENTFILTLKEADKSIIIVEKGEILENPGVEIKDLTGKLRPEVEFQREVFYWDFSWSSDNLPQLVSEIDTNMEGLYVERNTLSRQVVVRIFIVCASANDVDTDSLKEQAEKITANVMKDNVSTRKANQVVSKTDRGNGSSSGSGNNSGSGSGNNSGSGSGNNSGSGSGNNGGSGSGNNSGSGSGDNSGSGSEDDEKLPDEDNKPDVGDVETPGDDVTPDEGNKPDVGDVEKPDDGTQDDATPDEGSKPDVGDVVKPTGEVPEPSEDENQDTDSVAPPVVQEVKDQNASEI